MKRTLLIFLLFYPSIIFSQTAYQHIQDKPLYGFLDELAAIHVIDVNTAIKPYSRYQIAGWLIEAWERRDELSWAQKSKLEHYLDEFALETGDLKTGRATLYRRDDKLSVHLLPPEITWRDSLFRTVIRPVYGYRYFSSSNENFFHSYGGAEAIAYIGDRWSVYASLRDNYQNKELLALPTYLTQEQGGNYKTAGPGREGGDYSEMRGGITYTWDWGSLGLIKDHLEWGDNHHGSNIFSGRTPSFAMIKLHMNPVHWLEFDYYHGWLVSEVIDSTRSYFIDDNRFKGVYREKYIAANMYTVEPFERLRLSVGNSIVYSDVNVQPAYMIPFFFFKSLAHTYSRGVLNHNSMMFANISSRQIKHLHLYFSVYIDEFATWRVGDPDVHNFTSYKGGFSLTGFPFNNLFITGEYTRTTPMTYQHRVPSSTFETNRFNLGHYMRDNAEEYYGAVRFSPFGTLQLTASYVYAIKANLYEYKYGAEKPLDSNPVLQDKTWTNNTFALRAEWLPLPNMRLFVEYSDSHIKGYNVDDRSAQDYLDMYSPEFLHGDTRTIVAGFAYGFN